MTRTLGNTALKASWVSFLSRDPPQMIASSDVKSYPSVTWSFVTATTSASTTVTCVTRNLSTVPSIAFKLNLSMTTIVRVLDVGRGWGERDKNIVALTPLFEEGETPLLVTKVYLHACYYTYFSIYSHAT